MPHSFAAQATRDYFIALIPTVILLGVATVQAAEYYANFPQDTVRMKILVGVLVGLQYFEVACALPALWLETTTLGSGALLGTWYSGAYTLTTVLSSALAQLFFAFRISKMAKRWVALVIAATSVVQLGFGLVTYIWMVSSHPPNQVLMFGWCGSLVLSDSLIAAVMLYLLYHCRTGFPWTDRAVRLLMKYTVCSGLAALVAAILVLLTYPSYDGLNILPGCFTLMLGTVSTITVLANLHGRDHVRRCFDVRTGDDEMPSIHLSQIPTRIKEEALRAVPARSTRGIHISEEHETSSM